MFSRAVPTLLLMGLLSLMDAILEMPMARVLEAVPLDQEIKAVLLGEVSRLRPIFDLMLAQEAGDWQKVEALAKHLRLSPDKVAEFYLQAMEWAREVNGK